jgi:hypothetical protein
MEGWTVKWSGPQALISQPGFFERRDDIPFSHASQRIPAFKVTPKFLDQSGTYAILWPSQENAPIMIGTQFIRAVE